MILVNRKLLDLRDTADPRVKWYLDEIKQIKALKQPVVIKKPLATFRINNGKRLMPQPHGIQSRAQVDTEWGKEEWVCCTNYEINQNQKIVNVKPNFYFFTTEITLNPQTQFELIFYLTRCAKIEKHGYIVEDKEADAANRTEGELAELDVKYAIFRDMQLGDIRYIAKAWGVNGADALTPALLKETLFNAVKASEAKKGRGYKGFMKDVQGVTPDSTEARAVVNSAMTAGHLTYDTSTRHVKYTWVKPAQTLLLVPYDDVNRVTDYIADQMLRGRYEEFYAGLKELVFGIPVVPTYSEADITMMKTREELEKAAKDLDYKMPPNIGDEKLRERLIDKLHQKIEPEVV